ncbi:MAG: hypothetical protein AAFV88_13070 [Planctomycetota bacterium]
MRKLDRLYRSLALAPLACVCVSIGCSSPTTRTDAKLANFFATPKWMEKAPWSKEEDAPPEPYPNPAKLAATWTPDVLMKTGKTPTRGFGGRLFFFDERSKAVPVEGTLTIHGFEVGANGKDQTIKPFRFTPEQFTRHFAQSDFGASYSIWIPWDAVGGEEKRISLVATFQTQEGKVIQGSATTVVLPGRRNAAETSAPDQNYSGRYRSHRDAVVHHATRPSGLVTTTIQRHNAGPDGSVPLPGKTIQERLAAAKSATASAGRTPFVDVPFSGSGKMSVATTTPSVDRSVQPASAVMPNDSMPRRATMPGATAPRRIGTPQ